MSNNTVSAFVTPFDTLHIKTNLMNELERDKRTENGKLGCECRELYADAMVKLTKVAWLLEIDINDILPVNKLD